MIGLPLTAALVATAKVVVCVEISNPTANERLDTVEIVTALRARVARRDVVVRTCGHRAGSPATWHISVSGHGAVAQIRFEGAGAVVVQPLSVEDLEGHEVPQVVALAASEILRPFLQDRAPIEAAPLPPKMVPDPAVTPEPSMDVEQAEVTPAEPAPAVIAVPTAAISGGLWLGAHAHARSKLLTPRLEVEGVLSWGNVGILSCAGVGLHLPRRTGGVEVAGEVIHAGLGVQYRFSRLSLGLLAQTRVTLLRMSGGPLASTHSRTYWDGGVAGKGWYAIWDFATFRLGMVLQTSVWWRPRQVTVNNREVFAQAVFTFTIGFGVELGHVEI